MKQRMITLLSVALSLCLLASCALADLAFSDIEGTWFCTEMQMESGTMNPADFGMSMSFDFKEDGTLDYSMGGNNMPGTWVIDGDVLTVTINDQPVSGGLEDDRIVLKEDFQTMILSREGGVAPSFTPAEAIAADDVSAFSGVWHADWLSAYGNLLSTDNEEISGMWETFFGSSDLTISISGEQAVCFGKEETFTFADGRLAIIQEPVEGIPDPSMLDEIITLRADGMLCFQILGMEIYCSRADGGSTPEVPVENPDGKSNEPQPAPAAAIQPDVRYVCVSFVTHGVEMNASVLNAEYAVVFHTDGTAEFTLAGAPVPDLAWVADGDAAVIDYFGNGDLRFVPDEAGLTLDFFGSMNMRFVPAE